MAVDLELLFRPAARPDLFEDLLVPTGRTGSAPTDDAGEIGKRWSIPAAKELDNPTPGSVSAALAAGGGVAIDLWERSAHDAADLLIAAAHGGVGFGPGLQPRAETAEQVWTLISAAMAAIVGEDVQTHWVECGEGQTGPDTERRAFINGLGRSARETIRDVITVICVPAESLAAIAATFPAEGELR